MSTGSVGKSEKGGKGALPAWVPLAIVLFQLSERAIFFILLIGLLVDGLVFGRLERTVLRRRGLARLR
jgi:ABC-type nitrate/sulfonate/bicarbonate transport system permease component